MRYIEFAMTSNFSFLRGASHPEELMIQANHLGLAGLGLVTTVLAAIVVRRALGRVPQAAPLRLTCGVRVQTGLTLPSLWYLPLAGVRWSWTHPRGTVTPASRWGSWKRRSDPRAGRWRRAWSGAWRLGTRWP